MGMVVVRVGMVVVGKMAVGMVVVVVVGVEGGS